MKVATFTLRADARQSTAWKIASENDGFRGVGQWAATVLDFYLQRRARMGKPLRLAWHLGHFRVCLEDDVTVTVRGWISRPFAHFRGDEAGPRYHGTHLHSLVYLAEQKIIATFHHARSCRSLAAELVVPFARDEQAKASATIERHVREQV